MTERTNGLVELAERAGDGDAAAARQLRRQLQPQMILMVRQALARGGASPVARRILAEAQRLAAAAAHAFPDDDAVAQLVARSLCENLMSRLEAPRCHALKDTVRG